MALSDFLPYGAPELLEGASSRMMRSTMSASFLVVLLVAALGALMPRTVTLTIEPQWEPGPIQVDPNIVRDPPPAGARVPRVRIAPDPHAVPKLVSNAPEKEWDFPPADVPSGSIDDVPPGLTKSGGGTIAPPMDPPPGSFVYVDEMPVVIRCADAVYPDLARSAGVEGTVRVLMLVGLNGHVERVIVAPKGSVPLLDQAALDAARTCVFTPALANGHPVKVWVSQSYRFSLHSAH